MATNNLQARFRETRVVVATDGAFPSCSWTRARWWNSASCDMPNLDPNRREASKKNLATVATARIYADAVIEANRSGVCTIEVPARRNGCLWMEV